MPPELGNLTNLEYLNLTRNLLTGLVPAELGSLPNLEVLALGGNQLTGTIPTELGSLTNLENLYLWGNQLTGTIPTELGSLTNLENLYLSDNQLTGTIPTDLENLLQLEELHLHTNQLTGTIPTELGSLTDLEKLALSDNQLTGPIPAGLGSLDNLTLLYLWGNQLTGPIPAELGSLTNLEELALSNNQLTGPIPAELSSLANLTLLYLWGNHLTGTIPADLGNLGNLKSLFLHRNQLSGEIPAELSNLDNLVVLDLSNNQLTGTIPVELGNMDSLVTLDLSGNQLTGAIPAELGNIRRLTKLSLGGNRFTGCVPDELLNIPENDLDQINLPRCSAPADGIPMVTGPMVTSTTQDPGEISGYRFQFTTSAMLTGQDTITVHFDKDFRDLPAVLSKGNVTVSASIGSGSATTDASGPSTTAAYSPSNDAAREILTSSKHGLSNSAALNNVEYTFYVPDMNGNVEGAPGIAAGATVSVLVSTGAGIRNPTEGGRKGPIGVFTSRQSLMDTSLKITVNRTLQLSDYAANRNKSITVIGKGFQNGTTATIYLDNANETRLELVSVPVASDDTFQALLIVTVPPFVPGKGNMIYAEDGNLPPFSAGPVEFELEGFLTVSPTSAVVGDEVDLTLVDWPMDGPIPAGAVTIAGVTQQIIGSPSVNGGSATFRIEINTATPSGIREIKIDTPTLGESDTAKITIIETRNRDSLIARYDANGNGTIEKNEVIKAINDYLFGTGDPITKEQVIALINLYLFG